MPTTNNPATPPPASRQVEERRRDLLAFLFLTIFLAPLLAVVIVGGFGFIVWIFQIIVGPPGAPGG